MENGTYGVKLELFCCALEIMTKGNICLENVVKYSSVASKNFNMVIYFFS